MVEQYILVWEGKVYGTTKASGEEMGVLCFSKSKGILLYTCAWKHSITVFSQGVQ